MSRRLLRDLICFGCSVLVPVAKDRTRSKAGCEVKLDAKRSWTLHALLIPVRTLHMSTLIPTGYPLKIPEVFSTLRAHMFKRTSSSRV